MNHPAQQLQEMHEWLYSAYDAKVLTFKREKIDRSTFVERFGLDSKTVLTLYPTIRRQFEELDARAKQENYSPLAEQEKLQQLRLALAGTPELNTDRLTINRSALAEALGIPKHRFFSEQYADALASKEAEILEKASASKVDPYFNGRVYAFSTLTPPWPSHFLERLGIEFKKRFSGGSADFVRHVYLQIYSALEFIGSSKDPHCQGVLQEAVDYNRIKGSEDWEEALHAHRDHLFSRVRLGEIDASSADNRIKQLRSALNMLTASNLAPETSVPLPGVRLTRQRRAHLRSLAEVTTTRQTSGKVDYVEFARATFLEVCKTQGIWIDAQESADFFDVLANDLDRASDLPADAATAIRTILERRLDALRVAAVRVLASAREAYDHGQSLLSLASIDGENFENEYFRRALGNKDREQTLRKFFPDLTTATIADATQGLANLLGLIEQRHSGIPPVGGSKNAGLSGQFFAKRYLAYGGLKVIVPMLVPSPAAIGATLTLYLADSGANVGVGRTLNQDCMETSDREGHNRITGNKARAQGKPIIIDLPLQSAAVQAMKWLRSANGRLRLGAGDDSDRLFVMRIGSRVQLMTPHWYTDWFKTFAASTPTLQGLDLTPNMLRPSVLLLAALSHDGLLATGVALGQHGTSVSQGYQNKFPTRLLYDENIRRFQSAFETLVMSGVEDVAKKLGISPEQFTARLGHLKPTGLGTFCKDMRGRPKQGTKRCTSIDCWNDCPNLLIVAEVEAIAALQIWQSSLRAVQPEWERDRPERWDEVWLPWLCLTDVVQEKMARGVLTKVWKSARNLAVQIASRTDFVAPRPW